MTTPSLQCHVGQLPSTPTLLIFTFRSQYFSGHCKLNTINISSLDFCIWQCLEKHWNKSQLQHLANIPSVSVDQLYGHMVNGIQHITPFTSPEESTGDTASIWTLISYTGVYVMVIGLLIPAGLEIFCCYFFWH